MTRTALTTAVAALVLLAGPNPSLGQGAAPPDSLILATDRAGGWLNIDFIADEDPLAEAKACVGAYPNTEAVACYAFPSLQHYRASDPKSAGNFKAGPCWAAHWTRAKTGDRDGLSRSPGLLSACP